MKYIQNVYILALVAMMMTGCMDSALKREEHHHEHNNSIQMTAYNGGMELFAEITPMVVAEEVTLTAHCTHLDTFKPVTEGRAVATIDVAGHKIVLKKDLAPLLMFFYMMLFALAALLIENGGGSLLPPRARIRNLLCRARRAQ